VRRWLHPQSTRRHPRHRARQAFSSIRHAAGDDVHHASRQIARLEHLIKVSVISGYFSEEWQRRCAHGDGGHDQGEESEQWRIRWATTPTVPMGSFIASATSGMADCGPRYRTCRPTRRKKKSVQFPGSLPLPLFLSDDIGQAAGNFFVALRQVFRNIKEHLGTVVRRCLAPPFRLARRFDCVADVLAMPSGASPSKRPSAPRTSMLYPNPVAPVCRRCKVLRCDRFGGAETFECRSEADRSQSGVARTGGASLNQMGSRYSINPSRRPRAQTRSPDSRQNHTQHRKDSCRSPRPTPALSCAATCSETLMLSLQTLAAKP